MIKYLDTDNWQGLIIDSRYINRLHGLGSGQITKRTTVKKILFL
jgi:hypothetical protein